MYYGANLRPLGLVWVSWSKSVCCGSFCTSVWVFQLCHGLCSGGTSVFFGQSVSSGGNVCVVGRVCALWVESV